MTCNFKDRCLNSRLCYKCYNQEFLKLPEDKIRQQRFKKARCSPKKGEPSWRQKESLVASKLSSVPVSAEMESRVNPGSGNQMHRPGDVIDDILHDENKERKPTFTAKGKKTLSISIEWLREAIKEAQGTRKYPIVTFSMTGDDTLYTMAEFDTILQMAHEIKYLRHELAMAREAIQAQDHK